MFVSMSGLPESETRYGRYRNSHAERAALVVVGHIQADLAVPAAAPRLLGEAEQVDVYCIAMSDGSLIRASYHAGPRCEVAVEGARAISIDRAGKSFSVD